jgi:hypothetical protein
MPSRPGASCARSGPAIAVRPGMSNSNFSELRDREAAHAARSTLYFLAVAFAVAIIVVALVSVL